MFTVVLYTLNDGAYGQDMPVNAPLAPCLLARNVPQKDDELDDATFPHIWIL